MNSTDRDNTMRRWVPATVVALAALLVAIVYHRPIVAWFGADPDAIFGPSEGPTRQDAGDLHAVGSLKVGLRVKPTRPVVGTNRLIAHVRAMDGRSVEDAKVDAVAVMPAMGGMPEMRAQAPLRHVGGGRYEGDLDLMMNGGWPLTLRVQSATGGEATLRFDMATTIDGLHLTEVSGDASGPASAPSTARAINEVCPVRGDAISEDAPTLTWRGQTIGFCCAGCDTKFDAWPDDQKQAFVERSTAAGEATAHTHAAPPQKPAPPAEGVAYWTCSMHPSVKSKDKGACPICKMDLTPVTHEEVRSGVILVDAQRRQSIGVRTATAAERPLEKTIRAVGIVVYDETRLTDVTLKYRAWIGDMFADYTGKHVRRDEPLFTIYSPDLLSAQQEFLDAAGAAGVPGRTTHVADAARERLRLWDLSDAQIDELTERGRPLKYLPMLSPATGTIVRKTAVRGSAVEAGQTIYRIADLTAVWVEAEVYEDEIALIRPGQSAQVQVSYLPGIVFEGKVSYVYPYLDPKTRRGRVRFEVPNPDGRLKPDMYASVYLTIDLGQKLAVPEEAVLYGGENTVVFLDLGEGRLRPQRVKLGVRASQPGLGDDLVEVIEGLTAGDTVVASGNFLIASESKLKSGIEKW